MGRGGGGSDFLTNSSSTYLDNDSRLEKENLFLVESSEFYMLFMVYQLSLII